MSNDSNAPLGSDIEQPVGEQSLALLRGIERQLRRIADVLESLYPVSTQIVKDLGPVRDVPKPKSR